MKIGVTVITPESIYRIPDGKLEGLGNPEVIRREAALKLLGHVLEEVDMAVVVPGAKERALLTAGLQKGTWKGEIMRSFWLFKGFPIAVMSKHVTRGFSENRMGKAGYLSAFVAGSTILGGVAQQVYEVLNGRDPKDMTSGKFLAQAFLKGGSLGIYGDFLFNVNTQYGNTPLAVLSGPVAGYVEDLIGLTQGNLVKMAQGKETHAAAEALRFIKNNIPLQNLWYTRAVTDRLIFNQLQEMVSPGYMRRIEQRARKDYGQEFWYRPGSTTPDRAPDFKRAIGEK